jgi:uncharacterized membrane protein YfhO
LAQNEAEVRQELIAPDFDPHREVIIMEAEHSLTIDNQVNRAVDAVPVPIVEQQPHRVRLSVETPTTGFVVLTDTFYPGWQATVDGQPAAIWPANLAFRAVAVEAGKHTVEFSYRPRSFVVGLWISVITVLFAGVIIIVRNIRKNI